MLDVKRTTRALRASYAKARKYLAAARNARESGYELGVRACLETVAECRDAVADARCAIRLGRRVDRGEGGGRHYPPKFERTGPCRRPSSPPC